MKLLLYGVSHYTVPNADIHKYRIYDNQIEEKSLEIKQFSGVEEVLILSNETRCCKTHNLTKYMFKLRSLFILINKDI